MIGDKEIIYEKLKDLKQEKIGKIFEDDTYEQYYLITDIEKDKYCTFELDLSLGSIFIDGEFIKPAEDINALKEISLDYMKSLMYKNFKAIENKFEKLYENANRKRK